MFSTILSLSILLPLAFAQEWSANQFPNPRLTTGYKACKMRALSSVCDPDEILTSSERYRLNYDLLQLAHRTSHSRGDYCQMKGIEAILVVVQSGSQKLANDLNKLWNVDGQCKKSIVFVLSARDHKLYYSGEENTGLTQADFDAIVSSKQQLLFEGNFTSAISNILKEVGGTQNDQAGTGSYVACRFLVYLCQFDPRIPQDNGATALNSFSFFITIAPAILRLV
ncbi:unnamed protein product [Toxocara canis]|uniref:TPM_phosphatase domain-containing protein n=1 Tax=Toxocara canis TaxID=6265 RepID=A0A183UQG0_TOXCA|nr:unnamed protein product [Toxocara canis]